MQDKAQEKTQNPVLAIFKEIAQKRGTPLEEFTDSIGYTPKVVEAMEKHLCFPRGVYPMKSIYQISFYATKFN